MDENISKIGVRDSIFSPIGALRQGKMMPFSPNMCKSQITLTKEGALAPKIEISNLSADDIPEVEDSSNSQDDGFEDSLNDRASASATSFKIKRTVKNPIAKAIGTQTEESPVEEEKKLDTVEEMIQLLMTSQGQFSVQGKPYSLDVGHLREVRMEMRSRARLS